MATTRSTAHERLDMRRAPSRRGWRTRELLFTLIAAIAVGAGLYRVHYVKTGALPQVERDLASKRLLNLNDLGAREDLLPALTPLFPKTRDREAAAKNIYYLGGGLSNVGAILSRKAVSADQFRLLKPLFVVRRPAQFQRAYFLWIALF